MQACVRCLLPKAVAGGGGGQKDPNHNLYCYARRGKSRNIPLNWILRIVTWLPRLFLPDSKSRLKPTSPNNQKDPTVIYGLFRPVPELGSPPFCIVLLIRVPIFGHKLFTQGGGILIPSALHKVQTTAPTFYDLVKVFGRNIPVIGNESSGSRKILTTPAHAQKLRLDFLI